MTLIVNESSTLFSRPFSAICGRIRIKRDANLDVRLGLIGDLHYELGLSVDHMFEDPLIDTDREAKVKRCLSGRLISHLHGTEVIRVRNE